MSWHKELILRMTLSIEGMRPALLPKEAVASIDELRRFRHVFRNVYTSGLDPRRVMLAQAEVSRALNYVTKGHAALTAWLEELRKELLKG
ncbi:MAG: hypothetical protein AB1798_18285 [Spirochaetota bacterium]